MFPPWATANCLQRPDSFASGTPAPHSSPAAACRAPPPASLAPTMSGQQSAARYSHSPQRCVPRLKLTIGHLRARVFHRGRAGVRIGASARRRRQRPAPIARRGALRGTAAPRPRRCGAPPPPAVPDIRAASAALSRVASIASLPSPRAALSSRNACAAARRNASSSGEDCAWPSASGCSHKDCNRAAMSLRSTVTSFHLSDGQPPFFDRFLCTDFFAQAFLHPLRELVHVGDRQTKQGGDLARRLTGERQLQI